MSEQTTNHKRYVYLRWKILEYKLMYYHPEKVHPSWHKELVIEDSHYDGLEQECNRLAKDLNLRTIDYVDFPIDKPSAQLVLSKLSKRKKTKMRYQQD